MGNWLKEIVRGERWDGLFVRLCWMALVIAAIYGVQNSPLSDDWRTAIGEGIGIFGGVELILDKINDLRHRRTIAESQAKAERAEARADQEAARANSAELETLRAQQEVVQAQQEVVQAQQEAVQAQREAFRAEQETAELRRRVAELERQANGANHKE